MDQGVYDSLVIGGVDNLMAQHVSHLFIRDPLVIFEEMVEQDDALSSDHFEVRNNLSGFIILPESSFFFCMRRERNLEWKWGGGIFLGVCQGFSVADSLI